MPFSVILDGTVVIGDPTDPANQIAIPITTIIPPTTPGEFVFDYTHDDPATAAHIPVGPFIVWIANTFGVAVTKDQLPTSLQTLLIAVLKLHFDTSGNVDVKIQLGSGSDGQWNSVWVPVESMPNFKLDSLTIETSNMTTLVDTLLATNQLAGRAA